MSSASDAILTGLRSVSVADVMDWEKRRAELIALGVWSEQDTDTLDRWIAAQIDQSMVHEEQLEAAYLRGKQEADVLYVAQERKARAEAAADAMKVVRKAVQETVELLRAHRRVFLNSHTDVDEALMELKRKVAP